MAVDNSVADSCLNVGSDGSTLPLHSGPIPSGGSAASSELKGAYTEVLFMSAIQHSMDVGSSEKLHSKHQPMPQCLLLKLMDMTDDGHMDMVTWMLGMCEHVNRKCVTSRFVSGYSG